jgi:membrane fusion protein, copper/silver efflux system
MSTSIRTLLILLVLLTVAGGGFLLGRRSAAPFAPAAEGAAYQCPMHPQVVSDKPGECPICQMRLVKKEAAPPAGERRVLYYRNPMDPRIHSATPAKDSMGMDYVPVYEDEVAGKAPPVAGRAVVTIPAERRQLLGLRTEEVRVGPLARRIRTVGLVAVDERRIHRTQTKYEGYVERVFVDFTGRFVRRGEPLLALYSPELLASQQEYLSALRARKQLEESGLAHVARQGSDLVDAARRRLLLWDIPAADLERLEKTGEAPRTVTLYAEASGYVVRKAVTQGSRVTPADVLFELADLSHLWVLADVYESDLASVRVGTRGEVRVAYLPGRSWRGRVTNVAPTVEEKTRTVKVRLEVDNTGDDLKPDMFADVELQDDAGKGLLVPEDAVIDAGDRRLVFLDRGEGRYEPREVQLGARVGKGYEVLSGLAEGDRVVVSANFLLDSESSLRAALAGAVP